MYLQGGTTSVLNPDTITLVLLPGLTADHRNTKIPLTWIEGAGHNSNTDKPEQVNRLIEEFVADIL